MFIGVLALSASACGTGKVEPPKPTSCAADDYEENDSQETARELPPMKDDADTSTNLVDLSVHTTRDEDWFRVPIRDTGLGGNPVITATVYSASFEVSTWFICNEGVRPTVECQVGSEADRVSDLQSGFAEGCAGADSEQEKDYRGSDVGGPPVNFVVSTTDCSGTSDDDGVLYVRVRRKALYGGDSPSDSEALAWQCSYELSLLVE